MAILFLLFTDGNVVLAWTTLLMTGTEKWTSILKLKKNITPAVHSLPILKHFEESNIELLTAGQ